MFDIGFPELMLVAVVMLLVLGPERLPEALRTAGLWLGRLQRSFLSVKTEIEREIGMDEIRRQLHNEGVMAEMRKLQEDLKSGADPRFPGSGEMNSILPEDSLKLDDAPSDPAEAEASDTDEADAEPATAIATDTVTANGAATDEEAEAGLERKAEADNSSDDRPRSTVDQPHG